MVKAKAKKRGSKPGQKQLTCAQRVQIIIERANGQSCINLGKKYQVTRQQIWNICKAAASLCLLLFVAGCEEQQYRLLQKPKPESPPINPPLQVRQTNWLGGPAGREGSCAHASLVSMLHWQNQFKLASIWKQKYGGGEYASRIRQRLDSENVPYAFTENANLALLDYAHSTRRGAILWWKPSHCCTFLGWVQGSDGKTYAAILDNNSVSKFEYTEKSQFHRLWASYGGFALTVLGDPPSPPIYQAYESITLPSL
jgi:hypothetical protein